MAALVAAVLVVQGATGIVRMHEVASHNGSPEIFFDALRQSMSGATRVYGPHEYWFAFADGDYRGFGLPFLLSDPYHGYSFSFDAALAQVAPDVVLVNPYLLGVLASADQTHPDDAPHARAFWRYLRDRGAALVAELRDYTGAPVQVYRLSP
jgi:hypothetical protein